MNTIVQNMFIKTSIFIRKSKKNKYQRKFIGN